MLAPEQHLKQEEMATADVEGSQSEFLQHGGASENQVPQHFLSRISTPPSYYCVVFLAS